jgi:hypothetical protein
VVTANQKFLMAAKTLPPQPTDRVTPLPPTGTSAMTAGPVRPQESHHHMPARRPSQAVSARK